MSASTRPTRLPTISVNAALLFGLIVTAWVAGGAARADVLGQTVMRTVAWIAIIGSLLFGARPSLPAAKPAFLILSAALALVLVQLIPLPPALWQMLPGRQAITAAQLLGSPEWRPLALVPGATANSAEALVVPFAALLLVAGLEKRELAWLPSLLLGMIAAAAIPGLLQFSGAGFDHPLINDTPGQVSGNFANRNHFALFLAFGCALAPAWAFSGSGRARWRAPVAGGLVILFVLLILASGSRAGLMVGGLGVTAGLPVLYHGIRRNYRGLPSWFLPTTFAAILALLAIFIAISMNSNRAVSIDRLLSLDAGQDLRARTIPVVLSMVMDYFPFGTGFGGFDPIFRIHEPFSMLKATYFNHAHNDFLEIALDGGIAAILICIFAVGWWVLYSMKAWRNGPELAKVGSSILGLTLISSIFDYPARTPTMMIIIVIAAIWLGLNRTDAARTALPAADG
jgi:O-antigen ligase